MAFVDEGSGHGPCAKITQLSHWSRLCVQSSTNTRQKWAQRTAQKITVLRDGYGAETCENAPWSVIRGKYEAGKCMDWAAGNRLIRRVSVLVVFLLLR